MSDTPVFLSAVPSDQFDGWIICFECEGKSYEAGISQSLLSSYSFNEGKSVQEAIRAQWATLGALALRKVRAARPGERATMFTYDI